MSWTYDKCPLHADRFDVHNKDNQLMVCALKEEQAKRVVNSFEALTAQRDELLEACEEIVADNCPCSLGRIISSKALHKAEQAIAKAKG